MFRIFHFLALFGYLNILCYEVNITGLYSDAVIHPNETFVEVVMEEVLNMEHSEEDKSLLNIFFDDYRILFFSFILIPLVMVFKWLIARLTRFLREEKHPFYFSKTLCLPGYYRFLSRYRPF